MLFFSLLLEEERSRFCQISTDSSEAATWTAGSQEGPSQSTAATAAGAAIGGAVSSTVSTSEQQPSGKADTSSDAPKMQQQTPQAPSATGKKRVGIRSDSLASTTGVAAANGRKFLTPGSTSSIDKHLTPAEKDQRDKERSYTTLKKWSSGK